MGIVFFGGCGISFTRILTCTVGFPLFLVFKFPMLSYCTPDVVGAGTKRL